MTISLDKVRNGHVPLIFDMMLVTIHMTKIATMHYMLKSLNGPVRLQRLSQRMPTYEKLMQNVGKRKKSEVALS